MMDLWPYILPLVALSAVAGFFAWRRGKARQSSVPSLVCNLLKQAVEQGNYMSVEFAADHVNGERLLGSCLDFDEQTLCIDIGHGTGNPEWADVVITINFRINSKKSTSYYQFDTRLQGITRREGKLCLLLDTPKEILSGQRRQFVRILPLQESIADLRVWIFENDAPRPYHPATLGEPLWRSYSVQKSPLALADISAAGMRLALQHKAKSPHPDIQIGTRLLCLLTLNPPKAGQALPLWLDSTAANILEQIDRIFFGLNFNAWAVSPLDKNFVNWSPTDENGAITPLVTWVREQQLAQMAQRNIDSMP